MAHLAAFARLVFLVEVNANARNGQRAIEMRSVVEPEIAEQVGNGGRHDDGNIAEGRSQTARTACSNWLVTQARSLAW